MGNLDSDWWSLLVTASVAFMALLAVLLWRRRKTPGAVPLALQALLTGAIVVAIGAETAAADSAGRELWFLVRDALVLPGGMLILWFSLEYASLRRYLSGRVLWAFAGSLLLHLALYLPAGGQLLWSRIWWDGEMRGELTPLGLAFTVYALALFVLATLVLVALFVRSPAHRSPVALMLAAQVVVRVVYPLTALKVVELPNTTNILAIDFAALMYATALLRFRLFDLVPVARQTIVERMPDAIFVLDVRGRIADLNAAARRVLGTGATLSRESPIDVALARNPGLAAALRGSPAELAEVILQTDEGEQVVQVKTIELTDWQGASIGRLAQVHDITALRAAENRLVEHERALAAATERERLARDLHDSLGQALGYVGLQVATIRKLTRDGRPGDVDQRLDRLATIAANAHSDVRRTIAELAQPSAQPEDILAELRSRLSAAERDYAVQTSLVIGPQVHGVAVPPAAAAHLLHIMDEALANAIHHGNARRAIVSLELEQDRLLLSIEDDGRGFDPEAEVNSGNGRYGVRFMSERAAELGGDITIQSAPEQGTRVTARIPLEDKLETVPA